jgi:hypothetical protein
MAREVGKNWKNWCDWFNWGRGRADEGGAWGFQVLR